MCILKETQLLLHFLQLSLLIHQRCDQLHLPSSSFSILLTLSSSFPRSILMFVCSPDKALIMPLISVMPFFIHSMSVFIDAVDSRDTASTSLKSFASSFFSLTA